MPGTNAGTGQPIYFRCTECRIRRGRWNVPWCSWNQSKGVVLTGRKRDAGRASIRMDYFAREYRCLDCGHVGWSRHIDLKHMEERQNV